jgi:alpha-D-ribose 1-methylphosphonate 5-triphosphate synthase subunit PhnG
LQYSWNFGDGSAATAFSTSKSATHAFTANGVYTVVLTVKAGDGNDAVRGKANFVTVLGADRARAQAAMLADQAVQHLEHFDARADLLRDLARFVVERRQ